MTNYNDGKWHGWNGGECPVNEEVEVIFYYGGKSVGDADRYYWYHYGDSDDIIAFRVIKEHREPNEIYFGGRIYREVIE